MLEDLSDDKKMADPRKLEKAVSRAKAMCGISTQILKIANTQLSAIRTAESCGLLNNDMPALVKTKDSNKEIENKQKLLEVLQ